MIGSTGNERRLFDFIADTIERTGAAPTYETMARHMGYASKNSVYRLTNQLVAKGYLVRVKGAHRGLEVVKKRLTIIAKGNQVSMVYNGQVVATGPFHELLRHGLNFDVVI